MQKLTFLFLFLLLPFFMTAQEPDTAILCDMPPIDSNIYDSWPWVGNNQYLLDLVDSIENGGMQKPGRETLKTTATNNQMLNIPVKAWIHCGNNRTTNNMTDWGIEYYLDAVNKIHSNNNSIIRFYMMCEPQVVLNSNYTYVDGNNNSAMFDAYYTPHVMNIHFPITDDGKARGRYPWVNNSKPYACYITTGVKTLAHELGHALGLPHTHNSRDWNKTNNYECDFCWQEVVSRSDYVPGHCQLYRNQVKAEVLGDCLKDTDGDPYLLHAYTNQNLVNGTTCLFTPVSGIPTTQEEDVNHVAWDSPTNYNAVKNIMSYADNECRTEFTPMQKGVQYYYVPNGGTIRIPRQHLYITLLPSTRIA